MRFFSIKTGVVEKANYVNTIADGLLMSLSDKTLGIIKKYISEIFLVSDDEIIEAMKLIYERMKILVEPSSATTLAAVLKNRNVFQGKRVGIILTGGNVDLGLLKKWF